MKDASRYQLYGEMFVRTESTGLAAARRRIVSVARSLHFSDRETEDLLLAVGEAVTNAYIHGTPKPGSGFIYLGWRCEDDILTVTVKDEGIPRNPNHIPLSKQRVAVLGSGIGIMCSLMDEVDIELGSSATVILRKRRQLSRRIITPSVTTS